MLIPLKKSYSNLVDSSISMLFDDPLYEIIAGASSKSSFGIIGWNEGIGIPKELFVDVVL